MAVQSNLAKSALSLRYKEGVDLDGKDIIKSRKFSNIKVGAVDQDIYDTAAVLNPLMKYPVLEVLRTNESLLIDVI